VNKDLHERDDVPLVVQIIERITVKKRMSDNTDLFNDVSNQLIASVVRLVFVTVIYAQDLYCLCPNFCHVRIQHFEGEIDIRLELAKAPELLRPGE